MPTAPAIDRSAPIDRAAVVARHRVRLTRHDPMEPLTVGNGEFAFNADVTGLQTFDAAHAAGGIPLCTLSQWGWHSTPPGPDVHPESIRYKDYDTHGRPVPYLTSAKGQEPTFNWLRENPHRLHLGRISFDFGARKVTPADLTAIDQTLDLWTGLLTSRFKLDGVDVHVETTGAGEADAIAVRVRSPLLASGALAISIAFPYGEPKPEAANWDKPDAHRSIVRRTSPNRADIERQLDDDRYHVALAWDHGELTEVAPHTFRLAAPAGADTIEFACGFAQQPIETLATPPQAQAASAAFWQKYWASGAAIDLGAVTDPRANEIERRLVLSQYLMRANCAGSLPPAETGLTCNSWYGKFHLEMHWWHGVHFALWDRLDLFERNLSYYQRILPEAWKIARRQGYKGARWPKMVDGRGVDAPSPVGPLLIWQQPHPIYYAELVYRQKPTKETLDAWSQIVDETAEFMASYAVEKDGQFVLGPPLRAVQENNDELTTINPTYELTYWRWGLETAQRWRERTGRPRDARWDDVLNRLAPAPQKDGRYLHHDGLDDTYTTWSWEHPAIVGALGMLPGNGIDPAVMRNSLEETMRVWQWDRCWGWDFPMTAMCAARVGRPDLAIDALLIKSQKNGYGANGHVYQRPSLTCYLPGNGGFLSAIAMMAGGWDGAPERTTPGFPEGWNVRAEGFKQMI
jgi:hypothetical protein